MSQTAQPVNIYFDQAESITIERPAVALIDSRFCINCGSCRDICPVEAIHEKQRLICRMCPDCNHTVTSRIGESEIKFHVESREYASQHACSIACPLETVPEGYVNLIAEERFEEAYELMTEKNPIPGVLARICTHPCEDECKRGLLIDKPIGIRGLKRFLADSFPRWHKPFRKRYDTKIAIVGAGPAGITAAFDLLKKGYDVEIFEAGPKPGGMARTCIPDFRLPKDVLASEIGALEDAGMKITYNTTIGIGPSVSDLLDEGYAAVLLATGAPKGIKLPVENVFAEMVYDAVTFMEKANAHMPVKIGKNAIVIGAGSVAVDTARTLLRIGAESATCVCIEDEENIPAPASEIADAKEEGVRFVTSAAPARIDAEWITIKGVEFKKVSEISTNAVGALSPVCIDGSEFMLEADTVVFAVGQKADLRRIAKASDIELNSRKLIDFDEETLMSSRDRVFVAGDLVAARGSVVDAMASGRKAALAIDNLIQQRNLAPRTHELTTAGEDEILYPVRFENIAPQKMPVTRARDDFEEEVELGFTKKQAVREARRCMKCGFEEIDQDRCIGCGACIAVCPEDTITLVRVPEKEVEK